MENGTNNTFSPRDFLYILFRHKFSILILFFTILSTVIIGVYVWPETYEAKASLLMKLGRENVTISAAPPSSQQRMITTGLRKEDINSEIKMISNRFIIEKVINKLGTDFLFPESSEPDQFFKRLKYHVKMGAKKILDTINEILYKLDLKKKLSPFEKAVLTIQKKLSTKQVRDSDVIEIRLRWFDPVIAREVLNTLIDTYLGYHLEIHKTSGGYDFLKNQVGILRGRLRESEQDLKRLKEGSGISSYENQKKFILEQLMAFEASLKNTQTNIAETKEHIQETKKKMDSLIRVITPGFNEVYKKAEEELFVHEVKIASLNIRKSMLEKHVQSYKRDLEMMNSYDTSLKQIQRQLVIDENNYGLYRNKLEEARISAVLDSEKVVNVRIIEPPAASVKPVAPKKLLMLSIGLILGVIVGITYAFISDYTDHSIRTVEQVNRYLNLPVLASIKVKNDDH